MEDKNNLLVDLVKYLRAQNQRLKYALCGIVILFSAAMLIQTIVWVKFAAELVGG